jgi:hypothetical protein
MPSTRKVSHEATGKLARRSRREPDSERPAQGRSGSVRLAARDLLVLGLPQQKLYLIG